MMFFHCAKAQRYATSINAKACGILSFSIFMLASINTSIDLIHGWID
jgi:hypothetical protein